MYVNRTFYIITYIINGQLEADIDIIVGFFLCDAPAFPPQLVLVTRIPFYQPGVEGLEKEKFYGTQELDNINIDYIYIYFVLMYTENIQHVRKIT